MAYASLRDTVETGVDRRGKPAAPPCAFPGNRKDFAIAVCEQMLDIAAELFNVSGRDLRSPFRSSTAVSRVRQAMYVCHVVLQLNMTEIGKGFGRDRTTVVHACHLIEDMRDDPDFDQLVAYVERTAMQLIGGGPVNG